MELVSTPGKMEENMTESTNTIKNMGKVCTYGQMVDSIREVGAVGVSTGKEFIYYLMVLKNEEYGKMVNESTGLMNKIPNSNISRLKINGRRSGRESIPKAVRCLP